MVLPAPYQQRSFRAFGWSCHRNVNDPRCPMLPTRTNLPRTSRSTRAGRRFVTSAAIGFALTFVAAVIALSAGLLPRFGLGAALSVDSGVVLLFVPLCALVFAVLVEVVRGLADPATPAHPGGAGLAPWRPGHGEG